MYIAFLPASIHLLFFVYVTAVMCMLHAAFYVFLTSTFPEEALCTILQKQINNTPVKYMNTICVWCARYV